MKLYIVLLLARDIISYRIINFKNMKAVTDYYYLLFIVATFGLLSM